MVDILEESAPAGVTENVPAIDLNDPPGDVLRPVSLENALNNSEAGRASVKSGSKPLPTSVAGG